MTISHPSAAPKLLALLLAASSASAVTADEPREKPRPDAEAREKSERETDPKDKAAAEKRRDERGERDERNRRPEKPTPSQLKERLADLMAQAREAEANGQRERLADLKPQITELQQLLKRIGPPTPELPPELRPEAEKLEILARPINHVFAAAETLAAAEMPDLAHELRQKAEAMERELAAGKEQLMAKAQPRKSPKPEEPNRELQTLREENERLQRQLREISERLERAGK